MISHLNCQGHTFFPTVGIKVTKSCKMKCKFCCEPKRISDQYDIESLKTLLVRVKNAGAQKVCITGGEPLLYPNINEFISHSQNVGLKNVLLCADGAEFVVRRPALNTSDEVRFSVHGMHVNHDRIVGLRGAFTEIENAIRVASSLGINISVTSVVSKDSVGDLKNVANWCAHLGVQKYYLFGLMRSGNGAAYIRRNGSINDQISKLAEELNTEFLPSGLKIRAHPYTTNAECIIIYGDGEVVVDPYLARPPFQKRIGNILTEDPIHIFQLVTTDPELSNDYAARLARTSL